MSSPDPSLPLAQETAVKIEGLNPHWHGYLAEVSSLILAALQQAQQAQRERYAQIAEEVGPWHYGEGENVGQAIAAAIRKLEIPT